MIDMREVIRRMEKEFLMVDSFEKEMDDFFDLFSEKRVEMIKTIKEREPTSIRQLSRMMHRDIKNVFEDLKKLEDCKIVYFEKKGKQKKPMVKHRFVIFKI